MDGIQSWSTFEQQQQQESKSANYNASSTTATTAPTGINALYVSSGSSSYENKSSISPAASALLRQAALTATVAGGNQQQHHHNQDDQEEEEEDEFRLKFHWIRPHPAVVLALEDEWHMGKGSASANDDIDAINNTNNYKECHVGLTNVEKDVHPAVETSRLMDVYRYGQWNKGRRQYTDDVTANNDNNGVNNDEDDNDVGHLFQEKVTPSNQNLKEREDGSPHNSNNNIINVNGNMLHNLPLELPMLRINLASLVEPPLLSSWLPGEDIGISYEGEET